VGEPIIQEVEAGIDRIDSLFAQDRLFVFDGLYGILSELGTYSRELDADGEPSEKIKDKQKYHRMDALRYLCGAFPAVGPPEVVVEGRKLETRASVMDAGDAEDDGGGIDSENQVDDLSC